MKKTHKSMDDDETKVIKEIEFLKANTNPYLLKALDYF